MLRNISCPASCMHSRCDAQNLGTTREQLITSARRRSSSTSTWSGSSGADARARRSSRVNDPALCRLVGPLERHRPARWDRDGRAEQGAPGPRRSSTATLTVGAWPRRSWPACRSPEGCWSLHSSPVPAAHRCAAHRRLRLRRLSGRDRSGAPPPPSAPACRAGRAPAAPAHRRSRRRQPRRR